MSPIVIILLILILSISSAIPSAVTKYETKRSTNIPARKLRKMSSPGHVNVTAKNGIRDPNFSNPSSEELRRYLENRMGAMVEKIMQRRRSKEAKKWIIRRNEGLENHDSMMDENEIAMWKLPAANDLERGKEEGPDEYDYKTLIGQTRGGIRREFTQDLHEVSDTLTPLVRGNLASRIRKVRPHSARIRARINGSDESGIGRKTRGKRASRTDAWIKRDFKDREKTFKMHALVVRDEDIPPCCSTAKEVTTRRYFMCSGSVLTLKHAITTASCMHFADIYNQEIEADLGILVGATNPRAYVIKINRYEMHPNYNYDVDSENHATNNVAIIYLECSIVSRDVAIPRLPNGINDDVAHMCCGENCHLFTIVQSHDFLRHPAEYCLQPQFSVALARGCRETVENLCRYRRPYLIEFHLCYHQIFSETLVSKSAPLECSEGCKNAKCLKIWEMRILPRQNRHTARLMKAKHLPAPRHNDEVFNDHEISNTHPGVPVEIEKQTMPNETLIFPRRVRSPPKLAKVPFLFGAESRRVENERSLVRSGKSSTKKMRRKSNIVETRSTKIPERREKINDLLTFREFLKKAKPQEARKNVERQLAAVDWEQIEETMSKKMSTENRQAAELFAKNIVDETIKRLDAVLGDEDSDGDSPLGSNVGAAGTVSENKNGSIVFAKLMPNKEKNKTIGNFVKVFTDVVSSLLPPNGGASIVVPTDVALDEKDLDDPPPIYEDCPPLGAPIIINETLVALVAYTCDDAQNWVEWQYVNVAKNMNWLRSKISEHYEPAGKCSGTGPKSIQARFLPEVYDDVGLDRNAWVKKQEEYRDRNVEWASGQIANKRRDVSAKNFDNVRMTRTFVGTMGDPWFSRNSQPAPREHSNRPKIAVLRNVPVYNYNTCYVKTDGSMDCEAKAGVNLR